MAVELVLPGTKQPDAALTGAVAKACHAKGLVVLTAGSFGNVFRFLPPLSISDELLHEGLSSIYYNAEEDEFIRADKGPYGTSGGSQKLLLKPDGAPLFDASRYEQVHDFDARTGLAVVLARVPTRNEQDETDFEIREGVIHISGQEIIPCAYQTIERGFNSSPPKVLPGGKLLAITERWQQRLAARTRRISGQQLPVQSVVTHAASCSLCFRAATPWRANTDARCMRQIGRAHV